jgi:hypothetical protein
MRYDVTTIEEYKRFPVQFLTFEFLNPETRAAKLEPMYLVMLQ